MQNGVKVTDKKRVKILTEALRSIACKHIPEANLPGYWLTKTVTGCVEVLAEDTDIARSALEEAGIK